MIVRDTKAMIAGMKPELIADDYVFCSTSHTDLAERYLTSALAMFREDEGVSFVLPVSDAAALGFDCSSPMRCITLNVYSALDGVGLTAAVATVLARDAIPCNMIAAYHHDHAFVPAAQAEAALAILEELSGAVGRPSSADKRE